MINTIPEECAKMEEGIIDEAVPSSTASNSSSSSCGKKRLSTVSKQYDINGDGKLDEAELAMRAMDKSGRGHLTNEKVYSLMQEQLKMQKSLFQMKKVIAGLLVFVVILALSNLGTSFASAILAKDTTTSNSSGSPQLVDKKTGETVATDQAVKRFTAEVVPTEDDEPFTRGLARTNEYGVTTSSFSRMLTENAQVLLGDCAGHRGNKIVKLTYSTWTARTVCGNDWTCPSTFTYPADRRGNPDPISGVLCLQGTSPMEYVHVNPDPNNSTSYIISADDPNFLTSDLSEDCAVTDDCDDGLICSSNTCVVQPTTSPTKAPTPPPVPVLAEGETCSFMEDSPNCDTGLECVAEAKFESASFPVLPVSCGATTTTTSTGTASTDSNGFTSYSEDCSNSDSGDICHNNICGFCDDSTCDSNSNRPNCVAEDGRASYCGCTSDNDCDDNESCGVPSSSCVADITNYCSADHDADYGCGLVNLLDGERVSLTCKVPTCGSETCTSILPDGVVCTENIEDGCGSDDIHYCNSCIAVANGAEWIATNTTVPPK